MTVSSIILTFAKMDKTFTDIFQELVQVNCSDKVEKKWNLTYLSWAWAWAEVASRYEAEYKIEMFDGKPYIFDETLGYLVMTTVTIAGHTRTMQLPVMDGSNNAQRHIRYEIVKYGKKYTVEPATMFDINTAIMRCMTKNLAMFGLGHYIYSGEDLPPTVSADGKIEAYDEEKPKPATKKQIEEITKTIIELDGADNSEANIDKLLLSMNKNKLADLSEGQAKSILIKLNDKLKLKEQEK